MFKIFKYLFYFYLLYFVVCCFFFFFTLQLDKNSRVRLLRYTWVPDQNYPFPVEKRNLKFQYSWLQRWSWLAYSASKKGAFCKYCVLFAPENAGGQRLGKLVKEPYTNWNKAIENFRAHERNDYHKRCVSSAVRLLKIADAKETPIEYQVDRAAEKRVKENRKRVRPIIDTVIFLGRQGLALRGHRDSGLLDTGLEEPLANEGNFRALLRYRVQSGDNDLKDHLDNCQKNATYTSPRIQNEIVKTCNTYIRDQLVKRINASKCFSILADETTDISNIEQFSLCARYVDEELHIREDFLQFVPVYDLTGRNLADVIKKSLNEYGIDLQYLRGQGYDGAAAMSGRFNGVQRHISEEFPNAPYVHCAAHSLNLAVSDACNERPIKNCLGTISSVYNFLNTAKRQAVLQENVGKIKGPEERIQKLKQLCPTRWVERHNSVITFLELFNPVVNTLETIEEWDDRASAANASQLLSAIRQPEFIISVHVLANVFSKSLPLCRNLQKEAIDLAEAMGSATELENALRNMRRNAEAYFHDIFEQAGDTFDKIGVTVSLPRLVKRQTQRYNVNASSPEEYFRISIFVPFVDHFLSELKSRLLSHKTLLTSFMCLLPSEASLKKSVMPSSEQLSQLYTLVDRYASDVDVECNHLVAQGELEMYYRRVSGMAVKPTNAHDALLTCNSTEYPNLSKLVKIFATLPVSTSSNERYICFKYISN